MIVATSRYILIAILLLLLVNYPLLSAANKQVFVAGIPLLYVYLGVVWALAIIVLFFTTRQYQQHDDE